MNLRFATLPGFWVLAVLIMVIPHRPAWLDDIGSYLEDIAIAWVEWIGRGATTESRGPQ